MMYKLLPTTVLTSVFVSSLLDILPVDNAPVDTSLAVMVAFFANCLILAMDMFSADAAVPDTDTYLLFSPSAVIRFLENSFVDVRFLADA